MDECVSENPPNLRTGPNQCAVKNQVVDKAAVADRKRERCQNCTNDVPPHEHRGHIDGIATHPRNRPIIIGGGDPEHSFN